MNAIIGMAHLALRTSLDPRQHDYVTKILAAGQHLLGIIKDRRPHETTEAAFIGDFGGGGQFPPRTRTGTVEYMKAGKVVTTTTSVTSDDGKTLTVTVKVPDAQGKEVTNVVVYDRQ